MLALPDCGYLPLSLAFGFGKLRYMAVCFCVPFDVIVYPLHGSSYYNLQASTPRSHRLPLEKRPPILQPPIKQFAKLSASSASLGCSLLYSVNCRFGGFCKSSKLVHLLTLLCFIKPHRHSVSRFDRFGKNFSGLPRQEVNDYLLQANIQAPEAL